LEPQKEVKQKTKKDNNNDRHIAVYYKVIIILISFTIIISFAATYILTRNESITASIINISGRQRMLTYKIALHSHLMIMETSSVRRAALRDNLQDAVNLMDETHHFLMEMSEPKDRPELLLEIIDGLYFSENHAAHNVVSDYIEHVRRLLADWESTNLEHPDLVHILQIGPGAVAMNLDLLVAQYQKEGEESHALILGIERVTLILGLLLLAIAMLFVFRPLVARVRKQFMELEKSKASLNYAEYLAEQLRYVMNEHSMVSITDIDGKIIWA